MSKQRYTLQTVAKINNTEITIIKNGEKRIPIKPVCRALGVDFSDQLKLNFEEAFPIPERSSHV